MKLIILFLFLFLIDIYFYLGTNSEVNKIIDNKYIYKIAYWTISILVYMGISYIVITYNKKTPSVRLNDNIIYTSLFFILFISKIIGIVPLIIADIFKIFRYIFSFTNTSTSLYDSSRLDFFKKTAIIISGTLFSSLFLGITLGRYNFKKNYQNIFIDKWPIALDNYKIVHISDLHLGSFNNVEKLEEVVNMINEEDPNIVVFTGDLVNNYYHEAIPYVETLKRIKSKDGKFSVLGNHDYCDYVTLNRNSDAWKKNFKNLLALQEMAGFDLLLNQSRELNIKGHKFNITGVENWGAGNFNKDGDLDKAMKNTDIKIPTILLSHDPSHWSNIVLKSNYKIDLQLSGHTHGMQFGIEIPGFKWSPVQYRYKQWAGLYKKDGKQIYVNRGIGHLGYAGRVGIMPDISILKIKKKI